jgi:hypothetical protein
MTAIALSSAFLCPDCNAIVDSPDCCHACGNCLGLLSLASVLNRVSAPLPAPRLLIVAPFVSRDVETP